MDLSSISFRASIKVLGGGSAISSMSRRRPAIMFSSTSQTAATSACSMLEYSLTCSNPWPRMPHTPTRTRSLAPKTLSGRVINVIPAGIASPEPALAAVFNVSLFGSFSLPLITPPEIRLCSWSQVPPWCAQIIPGIYLVQRTILSFPAVFKLRCLNLCWRIVSDYFLRKLKTLPRDGKKLNKSCR